MGTAIFEASETLRQIVYTAAAKREPLYLVHDHGLYLMVASLKDPEKPDRALCAYAKGCHPDQDEEWWDTARSICGGDDFGEKLDGREVAPLIVQGNGLKISFSATHLSMKAA